MERWQIAGREVEYYEDGHIYLVDGVRLPSITGMLRMRFGGKYAGVSPETLRRAADRGTQVHAAIEAWVKTGAEADLPELRGFKWLTTHAGWTPIRSEVPLVLCDQRGEAIACGRCDLVMRKGADLCGADIKRTSTFDREYVAAQLNLYRIAYRQSWGEEWTRLYGLHLREWMRRLIEVPINEAWAWDYIDEWRRTQDAETGETGLPGDAGADPAV